MGLSFAKLSNQKIKRDVKILMLGLDASGKTTILYKVKMDSPIKFYPNLGFYIEELDYKGVKINVWDVGGNDLIHRKRREYYSNTDGLIFVVDSKDKDRIINAEEELKNQLSLEALENVPVLIMANKQDIDGAYSPREITELMKMTELKRSNWLVMGTSAKDGIGIKEGLDWMIEHVNNNNE